VARKSGSVETVLSAAPPLGLSESPEFTETSVNLASGEAFLLYTDGLLHPADKKERRLTPEGLAKSIDLTTLNAEKTLQKILRKTAPGDGGGHLPDDVAALLVLRTG
jgi:serine phosphatase RsbU (regulator of sigma subunit)